MRARMAASAAVAVAVALVVLPACESGRSAPRRVGRPTTSTSTATTTDTTTTAPALTPCPAAAKTSDGWKLSSSVVLTSPLVVGDTVVVGTEGAKAAPGCVVGVHAATGEVRWRIDEQLGGVLTPVAAGADAVLLPLATRAAVVDAATGKERWSVAAQPSVRAQVAGQAAVVGGEQRTVALDLASGRLLWERGHTAGLVADGATVYLTEIAGAAFETHALNARTGAAAWSVRAADGNAVVKAVTPKVLVAEQAPNTMAVVERAGGRQLWTLNVPGSQSAPAVAVAGPDGAETLLVRSDDGILAASDSVKRTLRWKVGVGRGLPVQPAASGGLAFVTGDDPGPTLLAVDTATGKVRWRAAAAAPNGMVPTPPVVVDSLVAVGWGGGVTLVHRASGKEVGHLPTDRPVAGSLARYQNTVIAKVAHGTVVSLPLPRAQP